MSTIKRQISVVASGNKFELFAQLSDIGRISNRPTFRLTVAHPTIKGGMAPQAEINVIINGIEAEDGSGESWMISGFLPYDELKKHNWLVHEFKGQFGNFHGLINTRSRTGFIYAGVGTR